MRILLVEDNETLADGLSSFLRGSGYAVDVVGDGASADAVTATETFSYTIADSAGAQSSAMVRVMLTTAPLAAE